MNSSSISSNYNIMFSPVIDPSVKILNSNNNDVIKIKYYANIVLTFKQMFKDITIEYNTNQLCFKFANKTNEEDFQKHVNEFTKQYDIHYFGNTKDSHLESIDNILSNNYIKLDIEYGNIPDPYLKYCKLCRLITEITEKLDKKNKIINDNNNKINALFSDWQAKDDECDNLKIARLQLLSNHYTDYSNIDELENELDVLQNVILDYQSNNTKLQEDIKILNNLKSLIDVIINDTNDKLNKVLSPLINFEKTHMGQYECKFVKDIYWCLDENTAYNELVKLVVKNIKSYFQDIQLVDKLNEMMNQQLKEYAIECIKMEINHEKNNIELKNIINMSNILGSDKALQNIATEDIFVSYEKYLLNNSNLNFTPIVAYMSNNKEYNDVPIDFCFDCTLKVANKEYNTVLCISRNPLQ